MRSGRHRIGCRLFVCVVIVIVPVVVVGMVVKGAVEVYVRVPMILAVVVTVLHAITHATPRS